MVSDAGGGEFLFGVVAVSRLLSCYRWVVAVAFGAVAGVVAAFWLCRVSFRRCIRYHVLVSCLAVGMGCYLRL